MACPRCEVDTDAARWCAPCERAFDQWSRRYATDIVWSVFAGGLILALVSMGIPLLGLEGILAATGVFAGFGTLVAIHHATRRRRRRQFLAGAAVPRAYLAAKP